MATVLPIVVAYLLGAIPFGLIIARLYGVHDVRQSGSGNIGATNVWRVAGPRAAVWVYLLDIGKGAAAVAIARFVHQDVIQRDLFLVICAIAAVLGHVFPVYLRFHGGKGVNTALGVMLSLLPVETLVSVAVFVVIVALSKFISLGSIIAAICLPITLLTERHAFSLVRSSVYLWLTIVLALVVIITHRQNISRLLAGTENKFSLRSKGESRRSDG